MSATTFLRTSVLLVTLTTAACQDSTGPRTVVNTNTTFTATVSGGITTQLAGAAIFDPDVNGELGFALALVHPTGRTALTPPRHAIYLRRALAGTPSLGVYDIVPAPEDEAGYSAGIVFDMDGDAPSVCVVLTGTVTFDLREPAFLKGSMSLTARCVTLTGDVLPDVVVRGAFGAEQGQIPVDDPAVLRAAVTPSAVSVGPAATTPPARRN
jgi:hypothetical protein